VVKPKDALQSLKILQAAGLEIPEVLVEYVEDADRRDRKVLQVWTCRTCGYKYETEIKVSSASHWCSQSKPPKQLLLHLK
jgi:predicted Zn-ribbon and HTH transcriptional regulator